jgi:hypothetical protein
MIGITISGKAYATVTSILATGTATDREIAPEGEYHVWLPRIAVDRLLALREPGETFSAAILRLAERDLLTSIIR